SKRSCTSRERKQQTRAMLGLAITTAGGVNSFRPDHAEILRGKHVVILPDNDPPGMEHAQRVAAALHGIAKSIRIVTLPALPKKGDLYDFTESGGTRDALLEQIRTAAEWRASKGSEILDSVFALVRRFVSLSDSQARVLALWAVHTHALDATDFTPY